MITPERQSLEALKRQYAYQPQEWQPPIMFPGNEEGIREAFDTGLIRAGGYIEDEDNERAKGIASSLYDIYHPDAKGDDEAREKFVSERINSTETFGNYVLYPSRGQVGRFADSDDHFAMLTSADRGLVPDRELQLRRQAGVLIAGCSVGAKVAMRCALGGMRNIVLADFDKVEWPNGNRIEFDWTEVGIEKTLVLADRITGRDPYAHVTLLRDGVTLKSLASIEHMSLCAVVDEIDKVSDKAHLADFAAKKDIPDISAADLGHISQVDLKHPANKNEKPFNGRMTMEEALAAPAGIDSIMRVVGSHNVEPELKAAIEACKRGERPHIPQLDVTAALGGVLAAYLVLEAAAGRDIPSGSYASPIREVFNARNRK